MLTTREIIKTLYNALIQRLKKHRGNWEQNDPAADDYIKNRPFYIDENKVIEIIPKQTAVFNSEGDPASAIGDAIIPLSPIIELVIGQEYNVIWDGMKYKCTAYEINGLAVIGSNFFTNNSFDDEPFLITINKEKFGGAYIATGDINSHVIEVTTKDIKKLDKKYLPNFAPVATSGSYDDLTDTPILATVATSGNYNDLTNKPTFYSDVIRYNVSQSLNTAQKNVTRNNIGAVGYEAQTLTDGQKAQARANIGAGTSTFSGSYNDLSNKPFYVTDNVLLSNTTLTTSKHMYDNAPRATASSNIFALNKNQSYKIVFNNILYNCIDVTQNSSNVILGNHNIIYPSDEDNGMPFAVHYMPHNGDTYLFTRTAGTYTLSISMPTIVCIDEKYIPDTIQRVADMPTDYVTYTVQTLTEEQKKQVRTNIGAGTSNYNDLINTPIIDNTLTISGAVADAKAVGDAVMRLTEQKADKSELEKLNTPKEAIFFIDQINGYKYVACMRDGNFITYCAIKNIEVTSMPSKTEYITGEYFDPTGMVVSAVAYDGTTKEIVDYILPESYLTNGTTSIEISYIDAGLIYTANIPITVNEFDPSVVLIDFEYTANDNGTYTITGWKETLNGEASTEMIIPNNGLIIV